MSNWLIFILLILSPFFALSQKAIWDIPFDGDYSNYNKYNSSVVEKGSITHVTDRFGTPCKAAYFDGLSYLKLGLSLYSHNITASKK